MYKERVTWAYNSWEGCQEQVTRYKNNSYKGFRTRQQAVDAYSMFVQKHASNVEVRKAPAQLGLFEMKNIIIIIHFVMIVVLFY